MKARLIIFILVLTFGCSSSNDIKIPYIADPVDMAFVCMEGTNPVPYKECDQNGRRLYGFILGGNQPQLGMVDLLSGDYRDFDPFTPSYNPMHLNVPVGSLKRIVSTDDSKYVFLLDYTEALLIRIDTVKFNIETLDLPCRGLDMTLQDNVLFMTCPGQNRVLKLPVDSFGDPKAIVSFDVDQPYRISGCKNHLFITHTRSYSATFMDTDGNVLPVGLFDACSDGIDNDGDGLTDNKDPGCTGPDDNDESDGPTADFGKMPALVTPAACSNGIDDDGDGLTDMDDPSCYNPLGVSETMDPVHRVNALVPGPDCKNVYALVTDPAMVMVLDAETGKLIDVNRDENSSVMNDLGIQGTLLQANPESGAIVKLSDGTYLWIYLANGEVVKYQIADSNGPKYQLTDSELIVRDSISVPDLLVDNKLVDGGFAENVDYPSMGPLEVDLIPGTNDEYSFYGVKFLSQKLTIPNEYWTVTFEGRIPDTDSVSGVLSAEGMLTDQGHDFCVLGVEKGDRLIFTETGDTCNLQVQSITITGVTPHTLKLDLNEVPAACLGKGLDYYIRATNQWVVNGSVTGFLHPWYSDGDKCSIKKDAKGMQARVARSMPKDGIKLANCPVYPQDPEIEWNEFRNIEFSFSIFPGCTIDKDYNITVVPPKQDTQFRFSAFNYITPVSSTVGGHVVSIVSPPGAIILYLVNMGADSVEAIDADTGTIEKTFY